MNLLNDCTEASELEKDMRGRYAAEKLNTLRNSTIQAMSNLLSANIDSGLMHSIGKSNSWHFIFLLYILNNIILYFFGLYPKSNFARIAKLNINLLNLFD